MKPRKPPVDWTPHRDPFEVASAPLSASFMSDAKWRKALGAIAGLGLHPREATWKFIDSDRLFEWGVPRTCDLGPSHLVDGRFPPVEYRWIEWIRFPRLATPYPGAGPVQQDLDALKRALDAAGRFQTAEDDRGLTLFAYARPTPQ